LGISEIVTVSDKKIFKSAKAFKIENTWNGT